MAIELTPTTGNHNGKEKSQCTPPRGHTVQVQLSSLLTSALHGVTSASEIMHRDSSPSTPWTADLVGPAANLDA